MKPVLLQFIAAAMLLAGCSQPVRQDGNHTGQPADDTLLYHAMVAEIAGHQGALKESVRHYRKVIRESEQLSLVRRAVRIMLFAKDYQAADEAVHKWLKLAPESMEAHQIAATVSLNQKDIDASLEHLEWVLKRSGKPGFRVVSALLSRDMDGDIALGAMETLVSRHTDNALAHLVYAQMAFNIRQYEKATASARKATELQPDNMEAHILLARSRIGLGEIEQSLADLRQLVDRHADKRELRLSYARLLVDANRFESAISQFKLLIEQSPDNTDLLYSTALIMMQIKNYSGSEQYFKQLLSRKVRVQESRYYLGRLEEERRRFEAAREWYQQVDAGDHYVDAQMSAARVMAKLGDIQQARDLFSELRSTHSAQAANIWLGESEMLRDVKQHQESFDVLDRAVGEMPDNMDLLYSRALAAERIDRIDILESDLKTVLQKKPDHEHALNALGYTLADRTDRYLEALEYIKRALELAPTDPAIIDSMGWVQYRLGNLEKALEYLRRALAEFHDSEIAAHLGEVLWVSGDREGATAVWDRALAEYPDSDILLDVIKRFKP